MGCACEGVGCGIEFWSRTGSRVICPRILLEAVMGSRRRVGSGIGVCVGWVRKGVLFCAMYQELVGRTAGIVIGRTGS